MESDEQIWRQAWERMLAVVRATGRYEDAQRAAAEFPTTDALREGWDQFQDKVDDEEREAWRRKMATRPKPQTRTSEEYRAIITETDFRDVDEVAVLDSWINFGFHPHVPIGYVNDAAFRLMPNSTHLHPTVIENINSDREQLGDLWCKTDLQDPRTTDQQILRKSRWPSTGYVLVAGIKPRVDSSLRLVVVWMLFNYWPENEDGDRYHTCSFERIPGDPVYDLSSGLEMANHFSDLAYEYQLPIADVADSDRFTEKFELVECCRLPDGRISRQC